MKVRELMSADVEIVERDSSLHEAAYLMRSAGVGFLPVMREERVVGVITDRDIVVRAVARGLDAVAARVRDAMTPRPACCRQDDDAERAERLMSERAVRRLVVVDEGGLLAGVVAASDLAGPRADIRDQ